MNEFLEFKKTNKVWAIGSLHFVGVVGCVHFVGVIGPGAICY